MKHKIKEKSYNGDLATVSIICAYLGMIFGGSFAVLGMEHNSYLDVWYLLLLSMICWIIAFRTGQPGMFPKDNKFNCCKSKKDKCGV